MASTFQGWVDGMPQIVMLQLWCFHAMDASGTWLDNATIRFEETDSENLRVKYTDKGFTVGEDARDTFRRDDGAVHEWVRVRRVPVAPNLNMNYPVIDVTDRMSFEVVGVPDIHVVRVSL
jgi:hypothetical protein